DYQTMNRLEGREVDVAEAAGKSPRGREGGHHLEHVADDAIAELVDARRPLQVDGHPEPAGLDADPTEGHWFGRIEQHVAERKHPGPSLGPKRREAFGNEIQSHDLDVAGQNHLDAAGNARQRVGPGRPVYGGAGLE